MYAMSQPILTHEQIEQKLQRMAWQIEEQHLENTHITLAGVAGTGYLLAKRLCTILAEISSREIFLIMVTVDKKKPEESTTEIDAEPLPGAAILVDDVLNSGRTLAYAALPFLKRSNSPIKVCVLVNRNHRSFPVAADFVGLSLATTLQEHVVVTENNGYFAALLE